MPMPTFPFGIKTTCWFEPPSVLKRSDPCVEKTVEVPTPSARVELARRRAQLEAGGPAHGPTKD
ncbi:MAG: hypothetical protein AAB601_03495 [Patescibacteria group bacterium]